VDTFVVSSKARNRRGKKAAKQFFRKLLKGLRYALRVIITDKLKSYAAAKQEILPAIEHCQHRYLARSGRRSRVR
jgi:putative transposase